MSAPTFPNRPLDRTAWSPHPAPVAPDDRRAVLSRRSTFRTVVDAAARIGSAVTLAALLVVTGMVVTALDAQPAPTGAATTGR